MNKKVYCFICSIYHSENDHENCSLNKPSSSESTAAPNNEVESKSQENEVNEALNRGI